MVRDDLAFAIARRYYAAKTTGGVIAGYPDDFAAWAEEAIEAIHAEVMKERRRKEERKR